MMQGVLKQTMSFVLGGVIVAAVLWADPSPSPLGRGVRVAYGQETVVEPTAQNPNPQLLFQGQLTDPNTNQPVPDGSYAITFALYTQTTGGTPLWAEAKQVNVTTGSFATLLGSIIPLNQGIFNDQNLYLGIAVAGDPEATPRQPIGYSAYAIRANRAAVADTATNADKLDNLDSGDFVRQGGGGVVAYGVVDANGSRLDGKRFSSSRAGDGIYDITIEGEDYNLNRFSTVVTVIDNSECSGPRIAKTGSSNDRLNVYIFNLSGQLVGCKFHFVSFEP
jgi:hypothetical protein